jgi:hypothetical protein
MDEHGAWIVGNGSLVALGHILIGASILLRTRENASSPVAVNLYRRCQTPAVSCAAHRNRRLVSIHEASSQLMVCDWQEAGVCIPEHLLQSNPGRNSNQARL